MLIDMIAYSSMATRKRVAAAHGMIGPALAAAGRAPQKIKKKKNH